MVRTFIGLAVVLLCASALSAQTLSPGPTLNVRFGGDRANTRVVIDSDAALSGTLAGTQPGRAVISLSGLEISGPQEGGATGLITSWRLTPRDDGARLSIALAPDAQIRRRIRHTSGPGGQDVALCD